MTTRFAGHLLDGTHAARPAFGSVPEGTLYACTDHALIYQSDGVAAWSTWATLGGTGMTNPMTTQGDSIYGGASGAPTRLAIGTAGKVWTVNAGATAPEWATPAGGSQTFYYKDSTAAGADQAFPASALWGDLFPTQMTASVPASTGNILRLEFNCHTTDSDGQFLYFDFTVAGTRVGATAQGVMSTNAADNVLYAHQMTWRHKVAAGDISGGNVAIKVQIKSSINVTPDVTYTTPPAVLVVTNLGTSS